MSSLKILTDINQAITKPDYKFPNITKKSRNIRIAGSRYELFINFNQIGIVEAFAVTNKCSPVTISINEARALRDFIMTDICPNYLSLN